MKYFITYSAGACLGNDCEVIEEEGMTQEEAADYAYEMAKQAYESYEGLHGVQSVSCIMEEEGIDEEDAYEIYQEEVESSINYTAELYDPEKHDDLL